MLALFLMKATWEPCGELGLPTVNPLLLSLTPAIPVNTQGELVGAIW